MKKTILTFIAIFTLMTMNAQLTWKVDKAHSSITFSVSHFLISEVTGNFGKFDISAKANKKFDAPVFTVTIHSASIDTNQQDRDDHLKSPDFFNIEKHPTITFKNTSYKQLNDRKFTISGKMTINGITKAVTFKGKLNGVIKDARRGKYKAGLKLTTTIEREAFNLGRGMSPIGKKVKVVVNIEMNEY